MYLYLNLVTAASAMGGRIAMKTSVELVHSAQDASLGGWMAGMVRCV